MPTPDAPDFAQGLLGAAQQQNVTVASTTSLALAVQKNGATVASEPALDFEDGTGFTWTVTDDSANGRVKVTPVLAASDGWSAMSQTLTYSSVDGVTGVVTTGGVDLTGTIPVGAKLKFTQTTVKYFIVTAVDATTITFYGGTDYTLANAAITAPSFSLVGHPVGFNTSPTKWTEQLKDTSNRSQATPTSGTWYNPGSLSLSIPIGVWSVEYEVCAFATGANGSGVDAAMDIFTTLSTANNSESDSEMTALQYGDWNITVSADAALMVTSYRRKIITLASKTTHYLNTKTDLTGSTAIAYRGGSSPTFIRAVCAYL